MKFKMWFENNDEAQERMVAFEKYSQAMNALAAKYKFNIAPAYMEREKQYFMTGPIEELRKQIADLPKYIRQQDEEYAFKQRQKEAEQKREQGRFKGYYQVEHGHGRIVCSKGDPGFDKTGMPAYPMEPINPKLKGYYGVHVGDYAWLGILKRDGYCDSGDAYLYTIQADQMIEDGIKVYQMEDPHVSYRDDATPDSWIIFSKKKVIPAKYISLDQVIPEDEIEEAPPPYGME